MAQDHGDDRGAKDCIQHAIVVTHKHARFSVRRSVLKSFKSDLRMPAGHHRRTRHRSAGTHPIARKQNTPPRATAAAMKAALRVRIAQNCLPKVQRAIAMRNGSAGGRVVVTLGTVYPALK
jgi:hypothetical protein